MPARIRSARSDGRRPTETADGRRYLKRLARGRGLYNLESWNARTIEDIAVKRVHEIYAVFTASHTRRV